MVEYHILSDTSSSVHAWNLIRFQHLEIKKLEQRLISKICTQFNTGYAFGDTGMGLSFLTILLVSWFTGPRIGAMTDIESTLHIGPNDMGKFVKYINIFTSTKSSMEMIRKS